MRLRFTSASLMRDILAGLCAVRSHKSLGYATSLGWENSASAPGTQPLANP